MSTIGNRIAFWNTLLFIATVCVGSAAAAADEGWQFKLAVYGWLPNIDVELPSGQKSEITRDDIVKNLDMAAMARVRAQKDRWSLTTDFIYFDLSHKDRSPVLPGLDLRRLNLEASLVKPSIGYRVYTSGDNSVELYAGARYFWVQPGLKFQQVAPNPPGSFQESASDSRWDGLVGVRGQQALARQWYIQYYADVGTGDSDSVVDMLAGIGYRFQRFDLVAAWRYMDYDFGNDWVLKTMAINGPLVGAQWAF